ncbi:tetratricopeptide repeat protein [Bizionia gelidisalsuginis]|uniref:Tetratricopeptide repeat protein n=1 Tax=Bizionia gelidisalsuginis TaxID=291188 RepID=A0ABY3MD63_9FLAO|nr:tetratricopeptide repeat protein [Bizionia gelidisalsuginis]TYC16316.1 tetratricopeptide repeat protein [Bizionia gelidisalsuginis]
MTKKHIFYSILAIGFSIQVSAQESATYTNDLVDYQRALTLYNNQQYLAAQAVFNTIQKDTDELNIKSDCAYYIANCAVRLNQQNADTLIEEFVEDFPTSTKRNTAFVDVADYYFQNGKYAYAQKWYAKVDESALSRDDRETFQFNNGYASFTTKNYKDAKKYLSKVQTSQKYGSQAKYYIGFMAYEGDDYHEANAYFDQVSDQERYKEKLSYYQADLNFKLGKFEKAIALATEQLRTGDRNEASELSKIIGESYFNLEQYDAAIPYLNAYKGKKGKWNNTDYYQLGYAYYKQKDYDKAISEFNKIVGGDNSVAQNAYYHLGESYVNLNKKQEALNAFRNASQMDYDLKIQEDAWLNYAKISYEIGNPYQSVPQVLTHYLNNYPKSGYTAEIETLLIDSYITSKNYKEALILLKGKNSFEYKMAYQKVAFYRGLELYNDSNYQDALKMFEGSLGEQQNEKFTARATFWKAETDYNLSNYEDALIGFKQFQQQALAAATEEFENLDYNLAYTYFKLKNYPQAINTFNQFVTSNKKEEVRLNDAYLRLADAYFVSSRYNEAISTYESALQVGKIEADYAFFQQAISYGYIGEDAKNIGELVRFISKYPESKLRDDAMYALGNAYVKNNQNDKALGVYDRLSVDYKNSAFVSKALLRQGLVYYNDNRNELALTKFKKVAREFPSSPEANQAVSTARLIYIDLGQVNDYAAWVQTLDYVQVTDADLDNATYEAAEKQFLDNNTNNALKQFNLYINQFPEGLHSKQAHFYTAQLYFKKDLKDTAKPHFEYVVNAPKSEFTEEALLRLSQIILDTKNWNEAIPVLKRLDVEANFPQNSVFAQSNLMQANYQLKKYNDAVNYAEKVLAHSNLDNKVKSDAYVIIARSAMQTGNGNKAQLAYEKVALTATGETAAEALYYNAFFKNEAGQHDASNTVIQRLAKDYSGYKFYGAKGLIIMAKNYNALGDAFQATYILESVTKNFTDYKEVVAEAQEELSKIKTEQAKTNASVQSED